MDSRKQSSQVLLATPQTCVHWPVAWFLKKILILTTLTGRSKVNQAQKRVYYKCWCSLQWWTSSQVKHLTDISRQKQHLGFHHPPLLWQQSCNGGGWVHKLYIISFRLYWACLRVYKCNLKIQCRSHQSWTIRKPTAAKREVVWGESSIWAPMNVRKLLFFSMEKHKPKMLLVFIVASLSSGRLKLRISDISPYPKGQIGKYKWNLQ